MARLHVCVALSVLILASAVRSDQLQSAVTNDLASVPLAFAENRGQWDEQVLFRSNAGRATMWFTTDGAFYQFTRHVRTSDSEPSTPLCMMEPDSVETVMIKASFIGADPKPNIRGEKPLGYKCNYFIGDDQARWRTNVTNYSTVVYEDLYPGIDLKYYGNGREMEYDFIVSPGSDPSKIVIEYYGAESVFVNEVGELVVQTEWGQVIERTPVVYQLRDGERAVLDGKYRLVGEKCFGFSLDSDYDPVFAVVIDPVLSFGTYLGGSGDDYGYGITVDASGAIYVTGETYSTDFPVLDAYQSDQGGSDVFVTKFSAADNSPVFSTYLGGSNQDVGYDITVNTAGKMYLTGITASFDFPMVDPFQGSKVGSALDGFVAKLSSDGGSLLYSTYLGGDARDDAYHIIVDETGAMYIAGYTSSSNFPTFNPYQTYQGNGDAFVTKLSSDGSSLVYSTCLGGSGQEGAAHGLAVDASGAAYVVGFTYSTDFPTLDAYQSANNGAPDAFVSKVSSAGNSLVYSTYLGGSLADYGYGIAVDASGEAYVTGTTFSTDFPTAEPYQTYQGSADAFITKFNSAGDDLAYSTYLGGSSDEQAYSITVDDSGSAYVIAYTYSTDFPTFNPYQGTYHGGVDAAVTRMNVSGSSPVFSTYLGGSERDMPRDIVIDTTGAAYVTGETISTDFPTRNPYQDSLAGNNDGFVVKLSDGEIEFSEPVDYVAGLYPSSVYSGDLDGDGDKDLAVTNSDDDDVSILTNNGDGTFATAVDYAVNDYPVSVCGADFDDDGDKDLAVANSGSNNVSILPNHGDATFEGIVDYGVGSGPKSVFTADLNGDFDYDLAVANSDSDDLAILLNNGDGTFATADYVTVGDYPVSVCGADFDDDIDRDLAVANYYSNTVSVITNSGDATFEGVVDYGVGTGPRSVFTCDLDGDGDYDVAVANSDSDDISILLNNGDATFATAVSYSAGDSPYSVYGGDIDGDGDKDLVVANYSLDSVSVLINHGDATFEGVVDYGVGSGPRAVCLTDVNGDSVYDIVTANSLSDDVSILLNLSDEPVYDCELRGDFNRSGQFDILDIDDFIDYLFRDGPPPGCEEEVDVDESGQIDILDIDYMVDYLFRGGPEPIPCP